MSLGYFPEDKYERKTIVVLDKLELKECLKSRKTSTFLQNEDIYYLPHPVDQDELNSSTTLKLLQDENKLQKNNILILKEENDSYDVLDSKILDTPLKKIDDFVYICSLLGAKEFSYEIENSNSMSHKSEANLEANASNIAEVNMKYRKDFEKKLKNKIEVNYIWDGSEPNIIEAEKFFSENNLSSNEQLGNLINLMKNKNNSLKTKIIRLDIMDEVKDIVEASLSADIPKIPKLGKLSANFENIKNIDTSISLKVTIVF